MTSDKICIKLKKGRSKTFKAHLEQEHPSTRGKIKIVKRRSRSKFKGTRGQINKMRKFAPDFEQNAADFMQPI